MGVDILTTTYRNTDKLKVCLSSVVENTKFVDYTWRVMANDPTDEVKSIIHDSMYIDGILFNDRIEPIFNDDNNGSFSSNNNDLAKYGNAEYILFLNDDIEPINDSWLLSMQQILESDQKIGAVGALLLYPGAKLVQHCGVMFDQRTNGLPFHIYYKQPLTKFMSVDRYYQAVTAACMLVRRKDFEVLGGFDDRFVYGFEDVDLCLRLQHSLGKKIVYCSGAHLVHHEGISGTFKKHPHLQNNINVFKNKWGAKIFNDHQFYLQNPNFMVYNRKIVSSVTDDSCEE